MGGPPAPSPRRGPRRRAVVRRLRPSHAAGRAVVVQRLLPRARLRLRARRAGRALVSQGPDRARRSRDDGVTRAAPSQGGIVAWPILKEGGAMRIPHTPPRKIVVAVDFPPPATRRGSWPAIWRGRW